ncbi:MAG TPA: hypothetical protein VG965_04610 [Patescibacteria group bacterium]|nr:hypothetical protein [Patescibacteria group bacterium]
MKGKDRKTQFKMSFKHLRTFWRDPSYSMQCKWLLFDLILYGGIDGLVYPSQSRLAMDSGVSDRYIRKLLKELIDRERIFVFKRGFSKSNQYAISEELYFLNEMFANEVREDQSSTIEGTVFPLQSGSIDPTKEGHAKRTNDKELHTSFGSVGLHPTGAISNTEK